MPDFNPLGPIMPLNRPRIRLYAAWGDQDRAADRESGPIALFSGPLAV